MSGILYFILGSAIFGFGFHLGREVQKQETRREAEIEHARYLLKQAKAACEKRDKAVTGDTVAKGPLPLKPGDVDRALKEGKLAFWKDGNGRG